LLKKYPKNTQKLPNVFFRSRKFKS